MLSVVAVLAAAASAALYFPVRSFIDDAGIMLDVKNVGTESCALVRETKACEDLVVHQPSGIAILSCTNATNWIEGRQDTSPERRDKLFSLHIDSGRLWELELEGFSGDFVGHGIGIHQLEGNTVVIAAVNHGRKGESSVSLFEHTLGTNGAKHLETVYDPLIRTPNDVVPVSRDSFYVTNDHYYPVERVWMQLAETITRRPWSNVVYRDGARGGEARVVADKLSYANGITADAAGKVYVNEVGALGTSVFQRTKEGELKKRDFIHFGCPVDNVAVDEETGAIYVAGLPQPLKFLARSKGFEVTSPSRVNVARNNTREDRFYGVKYQVDTVLQGDGDFFSGATVVAPYHRGGKMLIGGIFTDGIMICDLPTFRAAPSKSKGP